MTSFVEKGFGATSGVFNLSVLGIEEVVVEAREQVRDVNDDDIDDELMGYEEEGDGDGEEEESGATINGRRHFKFTSLFALGLDTNKTTSALHMKRVRVKRRFITNKSLHYSEDSTAIFRNYNFPISGLPLQSKHRLIIGQVVSGQHITQLGRRKLPLKAKILELAHAQATHDLFELPKLEADIDANKVNLGIALHPVQVLQWEDDIVWSEEDAKTKKLTMLFAEVRAEPVVAQPVPRQPFNRAPVIPPGVHRSLNSLSPTLSALASVAPAALSALIAQQRRLSPSPQPAATAGPVIKNNATRVPNVDFMNGDWLNQVIWDEGERLPENFPVTLVLSMNDPNLILDPIEPQDTLSKKLGKTDKMLGKKMKRDNGRPMAGNSSAAAAAAMSASAMKPTAIVNYSRPVADRFNLSNDKFYEIKPMVQKSAVGGVDTGKPGSGGRTSLQHSIPALKLLPPHFSTFKDKNALRAWHRPKLSIPLQQTIAFSAFKPRKKKSNNRVGQVIRNSKKLTLRDGSPFLVIEYSEEFPLLLQNPGMATHVILYYRKRSPKDPFVPTDPHALIRLLEPTDPSPLWTFGDVPMGQMLYVLSNNLYRAPLFPHTPPPHDFLMIRNTDKNGVTRYYLREMGPTFLAGQVFPLMEIYSPHSRKHNMFCRNRLQVASYRLFQKDQVSADGRRKLRASRLSKAFPQFSDGSIRKWLKEYAESQRAGSESGTWLLKVDAPSLGEDDLRALVTPEQVCIYEAMLAGQQRMMDAGLINDTTSAVLEDDANDDSKSADDDQSSQHQQETSTNPSISAAKQANQAAPWSLSSGFLNAINSNGMVRLDGLGDPSGRGEMFSFVKGTPPSLQVSKVTDDSSLADVFRKSRNNAELQSLFNQEKRRIWETQVKALTSKEIPLSSVVHQYNNNVNTETPDTDSQSQQSQSHHKLVIKRSSMVNGVVVEQSEEVTDPKVIAVYLKQRQQFDVKKKRRANAVLAANVSKQRKKRQREEQQALFGDAISGDATADGNEKQSLRAKKEVNVRCGACGAFGHMRTNRICPLYGSGGSAEPAQVAPDEQAAVRVEGTKLSINAEALNRIVEQERSFKFKIQLSRGQSASSSMSDMNNSDGTTTTVKVPKPRPKKTNPLDAFLQSHPDRQPQLQAFNQVLVKLVERLMAEPDAWPFLKPVSRRDYPHYYRMISRPIDLSTIRTAALKNRYLHAAELLAKVQLMANNCLQFNRADHVFTAVAFRLLDMAREWCGGEEVRGAEAALHAQTEPTVGSDDQKVDADGDTDIVDVEADNDDISVNQ